MMKILHYTWDTPIPGIGGSTHEWNIAKTFKKQGHDVLMITDRRKEEEETTTKDGVRISRVYWRFRIGKIPILTIKSILSSINAVKKFKPDITYERYRIFGGIGTIVAKMMGKKTILEVNDPTVDAPIIEGRIKGINSIIAKLWERFSFLFADRIITHHKIMTRRADKKKVKLITNGVDTEKFKPGKKKRWKNRFVILFIGSFAEWQGVSTVQECAKIIDNDKVLFVFVGEKQKNTKNTYYAGRIPYEKVVEYINNSDVCVYVPDTEKYEPMKKLGFYFSPLKLFEYMSCAKPVIVSDAGNMKRIVKNGTNGYRIRPGSPEELKKKILKLYKNKKLRERIGKNNRKECLEKYGWEKITRLILRGFLKKS